MNKKDETKKVKEEGRQVYQPPEFVHVRTSPPPAPAAALRACPAPPLAGGFAAAAAVHGAPATARGPKLVDVSGAYPYRTLCYMLEHVVGKSRPQDRIAMFERLWRSLQGHVEKMHGGNTDAAVDHFPFMRLLLPHLDSERGNYGLKESKIAAYYIHLLGIPKDGHDALRLLRWKDPTKNAQLTTHFSDVVYSVLRARGFGSAAAGTGLSVYDVNKALTDLCVADSPDKKRAVLMKLLRALDATEQKWLIRVIVKDMRMHVQHTTLLGRFHPCALDLYNTTSDLRHVCAKCADPDFAPRGSTHGPQLYRPFAPMLASLVSREKLGQLLEGEPMTCEPKYDGERMLIHVRRGGRTMYWTRNAKDYTDVYGPKFDPTVDRCVKCSNCILDGELLVWDHTTKAFKPFGANKTHALDPPSSTENFCYMVFDVVFCDGVSMVEHPLDARRAKLKEIISTEPHHFETVPYQAVRSVKDVLVALDQAVDCKYEGVVLKNAKSFYVVGERKLKWVKLKRDHIDGLADSMDLAILGGYYGTKFGRRQVSHFLLGVRASDEWQTFCKVGTGYTDVELTRLTAKLEAHWRPYMKDTPPPVLGSWRPAADDVPDMWIDPADTVVLEVVGFSFTDTTKFRVGITVRFPRVRSIRHDKSPEDAMTLSELLALIEASKRSRRRAADLGDDFALNVRGAKKAGRKEALESAAPNFASQARDRLPAPYNADSSALCVDGLPIRLCVFGGDDEWPRELLEVLVRRHGGEVVANPTEDSYAVAATEDTLRVRSWRQSVEATTGKKAKCRHRFVLHYRWLLDSIAAGGPLACAPRYVVYASPELAETFRRTVDRYGDSYTTPATVESLRTALAEAARVAKEETAVPSALQPPAERRRAAGRRRRRRDREEAERAEWEEAMGTALRNAALRREVGCDCVGLGADPGEPLRPWLFDGCSIWFDSEGVLDEEAGPAQDRPPAASRSALSLRRVQAALAGAVVATSPMQAGLSHVVVDSRLVDRAHHWRQLELRGATVVDMSWIDECLRRGLQVGTTDHGISAGIGKDAPTGFFAGVEVDLRAVCQAHEARAAAGDAKLLFYADELPAPPAKRRRHRQSGQGSHTPAPAALRDSVVATVLSAATPCRLPALPAAQSCHSWLGLDAAP